MGDAKVRRVDPRTQTTLVFFHIALGGPVAPNRRRRDTASGRPSIDLKLLKSEINLRREFRARSSRTAGPLERAATPIDEMGTALAGRVLQAAAEVGPGTKRGGGARARMEAKK